QGKRPANLSARQRGELALRSSEEKNTACRLDAAGGIQSSDCAESHHLVEESGRRSPQVAGAVIVKDAELDAGHIVVEQRYAVEGVVAAHGILVAAAVDHEGI